MSQRSPGLLVVLGPVLLATLALQAGCSVTTQQQPPSSFDTPGADGGAGGDASISRNPTPVPDATPIVISVDSSAPAQDATIHIDGAPAADSGACDGGACTPPAVPACGDGVLDPGEACDDGNTVPGDGCSGVCQIEPGYSCPTVDQPCTKVWVCGNGRIDPGETCDDGNAASNDGCSATCQVESGWECPVGLSDAGMADGGAGDAAVSDAANEAGANDAANEAGTSDGGSTEGGAATSPQGGACIQIVCGDGVQETGESCDDGNTKSGDGCSASCQIEIGWQCLTAGAACVAATCGDGIIAGTETCDDGNKTPSDGCSASCQVETGWQCPMANTKCIAKRCGDGVIAGNEQCDDGNTTPHDGCSATCTVETGFACAHGSTAPQSSCHATTCGDGTKEGSEECDDSNLVPYDGCSPTCTVEPKCAGGTCTAVCGDGLKFPQEACDDGNTIPGDGCSSTCTIETGWTCTAVNEPPPASLVIPILYRDMHYAGSFPSGPGLGHPDFNTFGGGVETGLVASHLGSDGEPVWASNGSTVQLTGATDFCWWYHDKGCAGGTGANPYAKAVYLDLQGKPTTLTLAQADAGVDAGSNVYRFDSLAFYPVDGLGWNASGSGATPQTAYDCNDSTHLHNFSFTSEVHYPFTYLASAPVATFTFEGDDDVYGFINGQLVIDLGGVHGRSGASVTLDATEATKLGLVDGGMYSIDVFQAERHVCGSTYGLTLAGFVHTTSQCATICGDGVVAGNEKCDNGVNNGSYGTCNANCTLAPYCGDDAVQSPPEQCDDGSNLATYGGAIKECGPGCKWAPYCGDGAKNGAEACDQGSSNQSPSSAYGKNVCTTACTAAPYCGDGVPETGFGEKCDNGINNGSYGTCNPNCTLAPYCGDGTQNGPEACDHGSGNVSVGTAYGAGVCTTSCTAAPFCGDGIKNGPEACDNGGSNVSSSTAYGASVCTTSCAAAPYCGDGIVQVQFGEQCDGTPGCNASCKLQSGPQ